MKVIVVSPKNRTVYNFRGDLIKNMVSQGHEVIATGPNRLEEDKITALGARFVEIPLNKNGINPIADIGYLFKLYRLFRKEKPQITFGYTIKPVIYGAIAARLARVPHVVSMVTGAGYLFSAKSVKAKMLRVFAMMLYKIGFKCANTIVFQNPDDRNEFVNRRLVNENKTHIVNGSGVNMRHFAKVPLPDTIGFFMLSRLMASKGVIEYLGAAEMVKRKHPDVTFRLLGAIENIQDSLTKADIQPYIDRQVIEYYGETQDVREYYKQCSVYVLPSYREGTPRTVLEAMAMGRPILTTDTPGCRETVVDGETGFIVPKKMVAELAEKMIWFIENPKMIQTMGDASHQLCKEKYDVNKVNKEMMNILKIQ